MYKIGDKVETPLGIGKLSIVEYGVMVNIKGHEVVFRMDEIKPYRTAHEKLIELGYKHHEYSYGDVYELSESWKHIGLCPRIQTDWRGEVNTCDSYIGLELSRILTQYLEELNENTSK